MISQTKNNTTNKQNQKTKKRTVNALFFSYAPPTRAGHRLKEGSEIQFHRYQHALGICHLERIDNDVIHVSLATFKR